MNSRGVFVSALLAGIFAAAAQDLPPGVLLVSKVKNHVKEQMAHMPQYTCLETFERFRKPAGPKAGLQPQDTVRLEVLFAGRTEFFDSPGGRDFKETNPGAFIGGGLIGSGMFAGHLQTLFVSDQGLFTYRGDESFAGHPAVKWDFRVPLLNSRYTITTSTGRADVASKGTFWADPETLDLIRLEVHADEIPLRLQITDAITTMEYARTRIGPEDVLLPQTGVLRMLGTAGEESVDRFEFTHCRSFQAQTSISFAETDAPSSIPPAPAASGGAITPAPAAAARTVSFPASLPVTIALATAVTDRAAVGELVEGRVAGNVMLKGKIVIPDGAAVHGRIRRLDRSRDVGGYFTVGLEFTEVETEGASTRFFASLENAGPLPGFEWNLSQTVRTTAGSLTQIATDRIGAPVLPGVGTFFMRGAHFQIPKGWKTVWKTQALN
jgi:hypothetical protein